MILIVLLIISMPISYAKIVDIPIVSRGESLPEAIEDSFTGVTKYIYAGSSLVASQDSNGIEYYHQDRLGSNEGCY